MMTDQDLNTAMLDLAKRLRLEEMPDAVATDIYLRDLTRVAYSSGEKEHWTEAEAEARRLLGIHRAGASGYAAPSGRTEERSVPQEIEFELDDYTQKRGELFAELAELWPEVRRFRRRYLRGRLMTEEEADAFLAGHETGRSALGLRTTAPRKLWWLARRLANSYGWREHAAARFVLTGRPPELLSVAVGFLDDGILDYVPNTASIVIRADVRVSVEEVAGAFKAAQRQILGGDNRKNEDKTLEMVRFVIRQIREHGYRPSWRTLLDTWNRTHPDEEPFKSHNALVNAFERVVHPTYNRPK